MKKLYRVDYVVAGKRKNYAINVSDSDAILMCQSLLLDRGYAENQEVQSVSITPQEGIEDS